MPASSAGFREISHTADWELEGGADLPGLFEQARSMYSLMDVHLQPLIQSAR
jgi:hypothetical protein